MQKENLATIVLSETERSDENHSVGARAQRASADLPSRLAGGTCLELPFTPTYPTRLSSLTTLSRLSYLCHNLEGRYQSLAACTFAQGGA